LAQGHYGPSGRVIIASARSRATSVDYPGQGKCTISEMIPAPIMYVLVPGDDKEDSNSKNVRHHLFTQISMRIRTMSSVPFWGLQGTLVWFISATWHIFLMYALFSGACLYCEFYSGTSVHTLLNFPHRPSSVFSTVQFLAAFLTGLTITAAAHRYKTAMSALLEFRESVETFRVSLCAGTTDPKVRITVQCLMAWMMCLFQKSIVFYTEDFQGSMKDFIPPEFREVVLFQPEVLWGFEVQEFQYVLTNFMISARIWDRQERTIQPLFERVLRAKEALSDLLEVRPPTTQMTIGKLAVHSFLVLVPLVNGDTISPLMLPFVAALFYSVLALANELSDPWGDDKHDLPLRDVMRYLSMPLDSGADPGHFQSMKTNCDLHSMPVDNGGELMTMRWLNRGFTRGDWTCTDSKHPIPRPKAQDPNKGEMIDFHAMRTLADVAGYPTFEEFVQAKSADMLEAEQNGRRMPLYLKWSQPMADNMV